MFLNNSQNLRENTCVAVFKHSLEADIYRFSSKQLFWKFANSKSLQISQGSTLITKRLQHRFFLVKFVNYPMKGGSRTATSKMEHYVKLEAFNYYHKVFHLGCCSSSRSASANNTYFVEDLWTTDSETSVRFFKDTYIIYRIFPGAASDSFSLPACNYIKKKAPAKMFICEFGLFLRTLLDRNSSGWLLLVFICKFWDVFQIASFIKHLWETAYFIYKLPKVNHHIQ